MDVEPVGDEMDVIYQGIERMEDFFRSIGMPTNFKELGVEPTEEELHLMANKCEEANNGHIGSALTLYVEDMYRIYKEAAKK